MKGEQASIQTTSDSLDATKECTQMCSQLHCDDICGGGYYDHGHTKGKGERFPFAPSVPSDNTGGQH